MDQLLQKNRDLIEQKLGQELVYQGKSYQLWLDRLLLPNGAEIRREHVHHPGGVAILAVNSLRRCAMVRQYRHPIERVTLEIPAGKLDKIPGETPKQAAFRELREETGYIADAMTELGIVYPSPGILDEVLHLFLAYGLQRSVQELDSDEFIHVEWISVEELEQLIAEGMLNDVKAICAINRAKLRQLL